MHAADEPDVIDLRDYLTVLRQQWQLVTAVTVLVVLAALVASLLRTAQYRAETELVVERVRATQDVSLSELLNPVGTVEDTVVATASSVAVAERAAAMLGRSDPEDLRRQVTITVVPDTQRLRFAATSTDPQDAARIATTYVTAFVEHRRDEALGAIATVQAELDQRAADLRADIAEADRQIAEQAAGGATDGTDVSAGAAPEVETLRIRRSALQSQLSQVILRGSELDISEEGLAGLTADITPAEVPTGPIGGGIQRTLVLALVLGLMLGVGAAFLRDHFNDLLRSEDDLRRATGGLPILGRIPTWWPEQGDPDGLVASLVEPSSRAAEAYRELSAGVRFLLVARTASQHADRGDAHHGIDGSRSILVTSADVGEGKTATAANLAIATARVGLRTILVDADLRRSAVADRFGMPPMPGLSDVLLTGSGCEDHMVHVGVPDLRVLTAGSTPPNPTELLASPAMRALHDELLTMADIVVYDTPAVLAVADTLEIGPYVDLGIVVGRIGTTTRRRLQAAMERLGQVGTDLSGAVLNGVDHRSPGYYHEDYYARGEHVDLDRTAAVRAPRVGADTSADAGRRVPAAARGNDEPLFVRD